MTEPVEGELLPAVRATSAPDYPQGPTHRHGICHYVVRSSWAPWEALCGARVDSFADTRRQDLPKCQECLAASTVHAQVCDCWKLFPQARLPR
jgi:hypothetical protein